MLEEGRKRAVEFIWLIDRTEMAAAVEDHVLRSRDLLRHALHDGGRGGSVLGAGEQQRRDRDPWQQGPLVKRGEQRDRIAVGLRGHARHDPLGAL
jgi:hypothetical protein